MQSIRPAAKRPSSECTDTFTKKPKLVDAGDLCLGANQRHTLPSDNLQEVVAFFELFDTGAVLLTNQQLSALAANAVKRIAVTSLHCLVLYSPKNRPGFIGIAAYTGGNGMSVDDAEVFPIPEELLPVALENCIVTSLVVLAWHFPLKALIGCRLQEAEPTRDGTARQ